MEYRNEGGKKRGKEENKGGVYYVLTYHTRSVRTSVTVPVEIVEPTDESISTIKLPPTPPL